MVSKNRIKAVQSLNLKKNRDESHLFVAEGPKVLNEMLNSFHCCYLAGTEEWFCTHKDIQADAIDKVSEQELQRLSMLRTPQQVLAIFEKPKIKTIPPSKINKELILALDNIQDPGNLGTIIRLADWFGIENIVCSPNTTDIYGPKTIQATMGALAHINIIYYDLSAFFKTLEKNTPIYGTFLDGENIYQQELSPHGIIIMGNEGNGISSQLEKYINHRLYIPPYPANRNKVESLNVSIATAITCAEFRRRNALK